MRLATGALVRVAIQRTGRSNRRLEFSGEVVEPPQRFVVSALACLPALRFDLT